MAVAAGILFALITLLSWGTADFFAKKAVDKVGYATSLIINQIIALGPIFASSLLFSKFPALTLDLVLIVAVTGFLGFLGYFYFYKGLAKGKVSIVSPIAGSWFVITVLVASFIYVEKLLPLQIAGVAVIFAGIFLASTNLTQFKNLIGKVKISGVLEAFISMIAWGFTFALTKQIVVLAGPIVALLMVRIVAFLSMFSWINVSKARIQVPPKLIFAFLTAAALLDVFGYALYNVSVETELISIVSPIAASYPVVTILLAYLFLKERLTRNQQVGIAFILIGLVLISLF